MDLSAPFASPVKFGGPEGGFSSPSPGKQSGPLADRIQPIASLNPYQSKWVIKARVTNKSEIKAWQNDRSSGKLFSVDLLDQAGGQIKATMFNEAVDKFHPMLIQNNVYLIERGVLKLANKKFSVIPNDYEMTLNIDAVVEPFGEDNTILEQKFHFIEIQRLHSIPVDDTVDVIGVVKNVSQIYPVMSKQSNKQLFKRLLVLVDESTLSVELTLWGEMAEKHGEEVVDKVVAVKACKVSGYGGEGSRALSTLFGSRIFVSPQALGLERATTLASWYESTGRGVVSESITLKGQGNGGGADPRKCFGQLKVEQLPLQGDKGFFFLNRCYTLSFRHGGDKPPWYNACPTPNCNRKVTSDESKKQWRCEHCNKTFPSPSPRFILSVLAVDSSGELWLTAFNEVAQFLLKRSAQEVSEYKEFGNSTAYEQVFKDAMFKPYLFKCRAKNELNKETGESKIRYHVVAATPVNYKQECIALLDDIATYL